MSLMLDLCSWIGRLRKEEYGGEKRREEKRREEKRRETVINCVIILQRKRSPA